MFHKWYFERYSMIAVVEKFSLSYQFLDIGSHNYSKYRMSKKGAYPSKHMKSSIIILMAKFVNQYRIVL